MLNHIKNLFPVNLSGVSEKTVPYVKEFTKNSKAEIHLLYVVEKLVFGPVVEQVVRMSPVPVAVVNPYEIIQSK